MLDSSKITSIWNNPFYETPPALSWAFKVFFQQLLPRGIRNNFPVKALTENVISVNVGKRESTASNIFFGGYGIKKIIKGNTTGTLTIAFNENEDYFITKLLNKIRQYYIFDPNNIFRDIDSSYKKDYYRSITQKIPVNRNDALIKAGFIDTTKTKDIENTESDFNDCKRLIRVRIYEHPTDFYNETNNKGYQYFNFYGCTLDTISDVTLSYNTAEALTVTASFIYNFMDVTMDE